LHLKILFTLFTLKLIIYGMQEETAIMIMTLQIWK